MLASLSRGRVVRKPVVIARRSHSLQRLSVLHTLVVTLRVTPRGHQLAIRLKGLGREAHRLQVISVEGLSSLRVNSMTIKMTSRSSLSVNI
jgi:hypothetical protein